MNKEEERKRKEEERIRKIGKKEKVEETNKNTKWKQNNVLQNIKKFWNFIWYGESLLSWIVFLVCIFIFIKFIFFPTLSLITGTALPLAIVESCSMYHEENFDSWWSENSEWYEDNNITKEEFKKFKLKNGFTKGDIFFIVGTNKEKIKIGDTIIFVSGINGRPIIHRVISLNPIQTKGDNNLAQFTSTNNPERINEININENQILGEVTRIKIPLIGWVKLIFYEPFRNKNSRGFCKSQQ